MTDIFGDEMIVARKELGWKWGVQQAIAKLLMDPDGEWTTWSDACILTEEVSAALRATGYEVVRIITEVAPRTVYIGYACDHYEATYKKNSFSRRVLVVEDG